MTTNNHTTATPRPSAPWVTAPSSDTPESEDAAQDRSAQAPPAPVAAQENEPTAKHTVGKMAHEDAAAAKAGEASRTPLRLADSPTPSPSTPAPAGGPGPVPPWGRSAAAQFDNTPPPQTQTQTRRPPSSALGRLMLPRRAAPSCPRRPVSCRRPPQTGNPAQRPGPGTVGRSTGTCCSARRNARRPRGGGGWCTW